MSRPFVILALPRSRTFWLSQLLTYGSWTCHHDMAVQLNCLREVEGMFLKPRTGSAETGMVIAWKCLRKLVPELKIVAIHRPLEEICSSLKRFGLEMNDAEQRCEALHEVSLQSEVLNAEFSELDRPEVVRQIWEFCLNIPFDWHWYRHIAQQKLEINMLERIELLKRRSDQIQTLKNEALAFQETLL